MVSGKELERRERSRIELRLKCSVERPGQADRPAWKSVENISRGGMLIRWGRDQEAPPAIGDVLFVKLKLPIHPMFGQRWMFFNASVVRVTNSETASPMVALAGEPVRFSPKQISREVPEDRHERYVC